MTQCKHTRPDAPPVVYTRGLVATSQHRQTSAAAAECERSIRKAHRGAGQRACAPTCPHRWLFLLRSFAAGAASSIVFDDDGDDLNVHDWLVALVALDLLNALHHVGA
eukprot:scaffold14401_cov178-Isochrysis_galbana.AAC.1